MNNVLIADLITSECKKKNVKIASLLQECNINHSFISDIRHKNRAPSVDKISVIADYLNVSVDYLLGRTDEPHTEATDPTTQILVEHFGTLSPEDKIAVLNIVLAKSRKQ
ncbi:MAG: helix-turn-helix domain-containing protein [Ruminococcus flavefaciens]|nr:helix-turn-helix domain-containing protein [Ruminococcus flavefaciens]